LIPEDKKIAFSPAPPVYDKEATYTLYVVTKDAGVSGEGITNAVARPNPETPGRWMIRFEFNSESGQLFGDLTESHRNEALAILLDGNVMSAPNINEKITTSGSISGSFGADEAKDLAITLNSGSMPVEITQDYAGVVGASIGGESAEKGVNASLIGLVLVMVFMIGYYRIAGLIANIALTVNGLLILGAFAYFNVTLTLPGIAGLILTIGMAVDANVLIFERIREEAKLGKSLAACIEGGYARASSAIWDANVTTLIAAVVLTQFGTGPVQGFAIALSIGICMSVFTALVVTRAILEFISDSKMVAAISMASILKSEPKIGFMAKRKAATILSLVVIAIGVGIFASRGEDNFGVDFTTGTSMRVSISSAKSVSVDAVRDVLNTGDFASAIVQESGDGTTTDDHRFLIRIGGETAAEGEKVAIDVTESVQIALSSLSDSTSENLDDQVEVLQSESVGPAVGEKLRRDAINAIFFALFFIILYLWFRFEWKYAVGAVVALVHDVLIVAGVLALFGREISIPTVAALLTIIGYSLNDTIVVFDRVREDLALNKSRGMNFIDMLNTSLNRTLSRTLLTSMTTLFVVLVLFIFGGPAINDFALALIAGVAVGTYSSLFVATPVVYAIQKFMDNREAHAATRGKKPKTA
ncbi:MAG TPA: protein translocase subunit SecD, partial [Candidatus Hydrogenedentes bacterium]|nr:protein translocase subunit SecD [Candidatus Hydrogenedentota bacterium]